MTYNCHFYILYTRKYIIAHKTDNFLDGIKVYHILWQEDETRKRMK